MKRAAVFLLAVAIAGCGSDDSQKTDGDNSGQRAGPTRIATVPDVEDGNVTPNADRIATLGLLNKRNNLTEDLIIKVGETRRAGDVMVKLESCERTAPWETPAEQGAFVQVFVHERPTPQQDKKWRKIFSGWLFKDSPALNVVEHPIYDVWVKACAMKYPGESAKPAPAASASSAPKPSGSESAPAPSQ